MDYQFTIIIPVYNRPEELQELLSSLQQELSPYLQGERETPFAEVIVVDDGSENKSDSICESYKTHLPIRYEYQKNTGPAGARNYGANKAQGEWLLFFDSDCIVPAGYFSEIKKQIEKGDVDLWGGPDKASETFTSVQRAIDYSMTSMITTGGIRGKKRRLDTYYPRTFNLGVRKIAFDQVDGFSNLRFGEDLDFSMRVIKAGNTSRLFEHAWVYHKRRSTLRSFFKQVYNSGMARVVLNKLHPGTLKPLHILPSLFTLYLLFAFITMMMGHPLFLLLPLFLSLIIVCDGLLKTKHLRSALLTPVTSFFQLTGYGTGLIHAFVLVSILGKKEASAFRSTFYK